MRNANPQPDEDDDDDMYPYVLKADGSTKYMPLEEVRHKTKATRFDREGTYPIGGVPLGLGIAADIWEGNLWPTPGHLQPGGTDLPKKKHVQPTQKTQKAVNGMSEA